MGNKLLLGNLLHLTSNLWSDEFEHEGYYENAPKITSLHYEKGETKSPLFYAQHKLRCDEKMWDEVVRATVDAGMNYILIDVGDAMEYESHPEISVEGAWSKDKLKAKIAEAKTLGLSVYPKLNFSACHDVWLGIYERMLGTPVYYKVVADLIDEVCEVFDESEYFHLGLDEETYNFQKLYNIAIIRNGDMWWHDVKFYLNCLEKHGSRPWIWGRFAEEKFEEVSKNLPHNVILSDWYYRDMLIPIEQCTPGDAKNRERFIKGQQYFANEGFDLHPASSNFYYTESYGTVLEAMKTMIPSERFHGVMQTNWKAVTEQYRENIFSSIEQAKLGIDKYLK